ncbi:MAG: RNA polymerase sigma factor [Chitinophagaceae bacterium]
MQRADHSHAPQLFASRVLDQDDGLLQELYTENFGGVEGYILKNSGDADDARDCYQESFLAVWRNIQSGKFSPADSHEFGAYLFQVARFKWIDQLRARKIRPVTKLDELPLADNPVPTDDPADAEQLKMVSVALGNMGGNCRELLRRFYFEKHRMQKIAEHFGWTEPTAKNNKYRCLQQLRALLRDQLKNKIQ